MLLFKGRAVFVNILQKNNDIKINKMERLGKDIITTESYS